MFAPAPTVVSMLNESVESVIALLVVLSAAPEANWVADAVVPLVLAVTAIVPLVAVTALLM